MLRRYSRYSPLLGLVVASVFSIQRSAGQEPQQVSPKAQAVLRGLAEHLQKLRSFSVEMSMSMNAEGPGVKQQYDTKHQLSVKKPDKLALIGSGGVVGHTVVFNGKTEYMRDPMTGESGTSTSAGEGGLDNLSLTYVAPAMPQEAIAISYIEALASSDPFPKLYSESGGLAYAGIEKIDGVKCHKLQITLSGEGGWALFVDTSDTPLIRRIEPDTSDVPEDMPKIKMQLSIVFKDWKLNPEIPDDQFQIPPSDKAGKAPSRGEDKKD